MYASGVPTCLLVQTKQLASKETSPSGERTPKRPGGIAGKVPKKPKNQDNKPQWKVNKKFDSSLKLLKQTIVQTHEKINLGMLMHAHGTNTCKFLPTIGLPQTACRRFHLWGAREDKECTLSHDDWKLSNAQIAQVKDVLTESLEKLADSKKEKS